ncbi:long-chain-fatty-acid--CoA ligase 1-like isoform X1 [Pseudoliparis swirei]|uniref:long-chain-fatty-acid--CoA ligase 1-like isoform X1 n=1 Tax=Pseudoliparis swirei TaxID=2059687 RepID=UPI0024BE9152|nr:long-chain-fatty-acid--CoA ligase 1-like isoform X1 [Pseudoliparis swirei]XP_056295894.1 long-chain-fatty-acid--CoA ligase 1-like isoform X1 [Pseudoliparis swirei]XP_056295895.1 long-chain-fatty-acid--CoA ligase 1-like isoform X1 [Pseudoliparis swirei]
MLSQDFLGKLKLPDLDDVSQYIRNVPTPVLVSVGAVAAATTYYLATRPKALPPVCDLCMQSVEVPGGELARRSVLLNGEDFMTHFYDDAKTMYECFLRGVRVSNNGPCLGSRKPKQPYEWISYREVMQRTENLGSAFLHKGHSKSLDPHIGIFSQNRPEWIISEVACYTYSLVPVPLYDTLGTEAISYIVDKAAISTIVCDVVDKVHLVLDCVRDRKHSVKNIVLMETPSVELVNRGHQAGIHILSLHEMEALGKANHQQPVPPQPEDMALICFTSGTTGNPKGAMLTHRNVVSNCSAFIKMTEVSCPMSGSDVHISFLPLAHMFERVVQGVMILHGARIGFFQGDIRLLSDDLNTLKPTVFPVVPRLLNRMYDKIYGQANSSLKRWLLEFAFRRKEAEMRRGIVRRDSIWDLLIFRKVQASLGGRVRLMLTGAAPISPTVLTFLRAAIGCQFYEGYGQTECTAGCTMTMPGEWNAGHVGAPLPCNSLKLVDVPEMKYLAVNGEGEVCVKGPNVFQGYLKDAEKTAEAIDADGWLHTGDIGKWLPNGTLQIVDRKKHIFKMAQGEYIAPEKIENMYIRCDAVAQVFVHGDSLQAFLVAVVVPDPDFLSSWAKRTLGLEGSYQELCGRAEVKAAIFEDLVRLGKEGGLKSFEQVKYICIHTQLFSIENGLLTPTLKAKRNEMRQYFKAQIDELYAGIKM